MTKLLHPSVLALFVALPLCAGSFAATAQENMMPPGSSTYVETRMATLEEQMRAMNGRLEQVEYALRRLEQTMQRLQADHDARLAKLEATQMTLAQQMAAQAAVPSPPPSVAVPALPVVQPAAPLEPVPTPNGTLGALKLQDGKITGGINNPQAPPLPNAPADYGLTPQEQYERGINLLGKAEYAEAEKTFKGFIDKYPKDKMLDNAKYWYGETFYVRAQYDAAAIAFADAYQQNPRGAKAPDSLLKLAMSLAALNKTADACTTLGELRNKYPTVSPTIKQLAAQERTRMKCPVR